MGIGPASIHSLSEYIIILHIHIHGNQAQPVKMASSAHRVSVSLELFFCVVSLPDRSG